MSIRRYEAPTLYNECREPIIASRGFSVVRSFDHECVVAEKDKELAELRRLSGEQLLLAHKALFEVIPAKDAEIAALKQNLKSTGKLLDKFDAGNLELSRRIERLKQDIAQKKESECPTCHYERDKHGDGLGLPEDLANQYIGCEYCAIKVENASLKAQVERLSAPVSDKEFSANYFANARSSRFASSLTAVNRIIASRAAKEKQECPDCKAAREHGYSDATTPGFFYTECPIHSPEKDKP